LKKHSSQLTLRTARLGARLVCLLCTRICPQKVIDLNGRGPIKAPSQRRLKGSLRAYFANRTINAVLTGNTRQHVTLL
jgi:hypothetical protein